MWLYLALPIGLMVSLRFDNEPQILFLLLLTVFASDTAQYYGGRQFGRRSLAKTISPNKTIEGAAKKINTVDTTAAGDTYIGYYISSISKEKSVKESMQIASRAAAISTTKLGGATSIPTLN